MATLKDAKHYLCETHGGYVDKHLCYHSVKTRHLAYMSDPYDTDYGREEVDAPFLHWDDFAVFSKPFDWRQYLDPGSDLDHERYYSDPKFGWASPFLSEEPTRKFVKHTLQLTQELRYFVLKEPMPTEPREWLPGERDHFLEVVYPVQGYVFATSLKVDSKMDREMRRLKHSLSVIKHPMELASQLLLRQALEESGASEQLLLLLLEFLGSNVGKLDNKRVCTACFRVQTTFSCPLAEAVQKEREILEKLSEYNINGEKPRRKKKKKNKKDKMKEKLENQLQKYQSVLCPYSTSGHTFQLYSETRV